MRLTVVFGEALLASFANHHSAVGALSNMNLLPSVLQWRRINDWHILQHGWQLISANHNTRTSLLRDTYIGERGE